MKTNSRFAVARPILFALLMAGCLLGTAMAVRDSSRSAFDLHPSPRPSPPNGVVDKVAAFRGREGVVRLLAQANAAKAARVPAKSPAEKTPEQKKRIKSAVILLSVLSGIALSGLLLIIASISIRGLQRKLAGPTRLDREPADLFPTMAPRPEPDAPPAPESCSTTADPSSQETRLT